MPRFADGDQYHHGNNSALAEYRASSAKVEPRRSGAGMARKLLRYSTTALLLRICLPAALHAQTGPVVAPSEALPGAPAIPAHQQIPVNPAGLSLLQAVQATLLQNPSLRIEQLQVQISEGAKQIATGAFDFATGSNLFQQRTIVPLTTYEQSSNGTTAADQVVETTTLSSNGSKLFRNGISLTPTVDLSRTVDNLLYTTGSNVANVSLQVTIPLLQGRGRAVVDAQEVASTQEVAATRLDLMQLIAQLTTATVTDYWNLVSSYKVLAIDIASEKRSVEYRNNVQALIDADAVPRSDINAVVANLAQRSATRALAQQQLITAQQQLALDMGTDAAGMLTAPQPSDDFPDSTVAARVREDGPSLHGYLDTALLNRGDYRAAQVRTRENQTLLVAAKNRLLPQLNVTMSAGYTGLNEGRQLTTFLTPLGTNVYGPNAVAGLSYSFPVGNHVAKGLLLQSRAGVGQAVARTDDVARNIAAAIVDAASAVNNAIVQTQQARLSVEAYKAALSGQRDRYRLGTGSIVEILTVEDLLTNAMLTQVQAETTYAQSLTQFRYAVGQLMAPDQATQVLVPETFRTLPPAAAESSQQPGPPQ